MDADRARALLSEHFGAAWAWISEHCHAESFWLGMADRYAELTAEGDDHARLAEAAGVLADEASVRAEC